METRNTISDPNFSIVVPGPCNANCGFCFWRKEGHDKIAAPAEYLTRLEKVLNGLPAQFRQISITGGEPTLSPHFLSILKIIRFFRSYKKRFPKVVLTTNGTRVGDFTRHLKGAVDFVNISRHSHEDSENDLIFGSKMSTKYQLIERIKEIHALGIPVTANCVLTADRDCALWSERERPEKRRWFILNYINGMKALGFVSVCFRHNHGTGIDLEPRGPELSFLDHQPVSEARCPVCRTTQRIIAGTLTYWNDSISEPSEKMNSVYEVVLQPDGRLTIDWAGKVEVEI